MTSAEYQAIANAINHAIARLAGRTSKEILQDLRTAERQYREKEQVQAAVELAQLRGHLP